MEVSGTPPELHSSINGVLGRESRWKPFSLLQANVPGKNKVKFLHKAALSLLFKVSLKCSLMDLRFCPYLGLILKGSVQVC